MVWSFCKDKYYLSRIQFSDDILQRPIKRRAIPIFHNKAMWNGNVALDGGALQVTESEYGAFKDCPYLKRLLGGAELLWNKRRYVIWLVNVSEPEINRFPNVFARVKQCQQHRSKMSTGSQKNVQSPALFRDTKNPELFLAIPVTWPIEVGESTELRYIPMRVYRDFIPTNQVQFLPYCQAYEFGVMASSVHGTWVQIVYERNHRKNYYAKDVIYNNFPWPNPTKIQRYHIEQSALKLRNVLAKYSDKYSVAEMMQRYHSLPDLKKAYEDNDKEVKKAYGQDGWTLQDDFKSLLIRTYYLTDTVLMLHNRGAGWNLGIQWLGLPSVKGYLEGKLTKEELFEDAKQYKKELKRRHSSEMMSFLKFVEVQKAKEEAKKRNAKRKRLSYYEIFSPHLLHRKA